MNEKWLHRADLAESAINERHASRVWGLPNTNLAVAAWPPHTKEKLFYRWHYWWQAHYLDCLVDAAIRRPTKARKQRIQQTITGIRVRNLGQFTRNNYYDDKLWLALALGRAHKVLNPRRTKKKSLVALEENILDGIDAVMAVLPWRVGEMFFNVPMNAPGAILMARTGQVAKARFLVDWVFNELIDDHGLVMDGIRMSMNGPEVVKNLHPYCQGVMMGACLELTLRLRESPETYEDSMAYQAHVRSVLHAVEKDMATPTGVINWDTRDGDGGLFKGILARYLADVAVRLPDDSEANVAAKKLARKLVLSSAESVWNHRLEVDGLPVFASDWLGDAKLPHNYGLTTKPLSDYVRLVRIDERDLSVQLSGWMLLEAAARISAADPVEGE